MSANAPYEVIQLENLALAVKEEIRALRLIIGDMDRLTDKDMSAHPPYVASDVYRITKNLLIALDDAGLAMKDEEWIG